MIPFPDVFDNTMLSLAKGCKRKFWLMQMQHWKPRGDSVHLVAGKAFASGLETARMAFFVEGKTAADAESLGCMALLKEYGDFQCPPESAKSPERTVGALEYYFDVYPLEKEQAIPVTLPGGKKGIEFNFVEPLPILHPVTREPIVFCGRLDQVVEYAGAWYGEDDKTATSLGGSWSQQWGLRGQFTGYCWGFKQATGKELNGFLIRGVSILKTKYDTQQAIVYRPKHMVDEWFVGAVRLIEELLKDWEGMQDYPSLTQPPSHLFVKNLDHTCADYGGCSFRDICPHEDMEPWLNTYFERRKWEPITRTETLL